MLDPVEKKILKWLAERMPKWVTPDFCTVVGIIGAVTILISYILSRINPLFLWLASFGFLINWFGDSLDGTLARHRRIERPNYGFFVDHIVDAFNEMIILLGFGLTLYVRFDLACLVLCVYMLLSILVFVRTCTHGEFNFAYCKLGPTEIRILVIIFNTAMYFGGLHVMSLSAPIVGKITFSPYDVVLLTIGPLMFFSFCVTAIKESIMLSKIDRSPGAH